MIAVGAAIAAGAVAASGVAAVGLTIATGLEIVAAVGATLAAVGSITRDKTLTMVGGAIGAIGAIGSLASAAGIFGSAPASTLFGPSTAASTADTSASAGSTFAEGLTPTATGEASAGVESGGFDAAGAASADAQSAGTITDISAQMQQPPPAGGYTSLSDVSQNSTDSGLASAGTTNTSASNTTGLINGTTASTETPGTVGAAAADTTPPGEASNQAIDLTGTEPPRPPNDLGTLDPNTGQTITSAVDPVTGKIVSEPGGSSGVFGSILKFAQDNKVVTAGILQAGGSLLSGLTSTVTPAQVGALNAQAAANNAAAALAQQQLQNLQMPKSVASSTPVTGTPGTLIPPSSGLINSAPKTGVAA